MILRRNGSGPALAGPLLAALLAASCRSTPPAPAAAPGPGAPAPDASEARRGARLSLVPLARGLPRHSQWRGALDVADLDGDGALDLVSGPPRKGSRRPGLFLGDGLGAFRFWVESRFPSLDLDYGAAAAGDWNGDGRVDVAFAVHLRGLVALVQESPGRFVPFGEGLALRPLDASGSPVPFSSRALRAVDWDGDGRTDLVALGEGPGRFETAAASAELRGFRVFLNRGRWETVRPPSPEEEFGDGLAIGDVDADGHPDAVVVSGVLGSKRVLRRGLGDSWSAEEIDALRSNAWVTAVAVGRFDLDSRDDVAVAWLSAEGGAWRHGVDVLLSRPDAFERRPLWSDAGRVRIGGLDSGDVDGDAFADLVSLDEVGTLRVFLRDPRGLLAPDAVVAAPASRAGCGGARLLLRDVDRDGKDDVIATFAGEPGSASGLTRTCASGGAIEVWTAVPR